MRKAQFVLLAVALTTALFALTGGASAAENKTKKGTEKKSAKMVTAPASRIYIDPATGEMTTPPPQPGARLADPAPRSQPVVIKNPDGSMRVTVPRDRLLYFVATTNPDGTVSVSEAQGEDLSKKSGKKSEEGSK